jgi:hypothetical protein
LPIFDLEELARKYAFPKSQIGNRKSRIQLSAFAEATAQKSSLFSTTASGDWRQGASNS